MKGTLLVLVGLLSALNAYAAPSVEKPVIARQSTTTVILNDQQMDEVVAGEEVHFNFGTIVVEYKEQNLVPTPPPVIPPTPVFGRDLSTFINRQLTGGGG